MGQSESQPESSNTSQQALRQSAQRTSGKSPFSVDDKRAQKLRERCGKIRILIIGRANAGKTTILQSICNTMDNPVIYDPKGNEVSNYSNSHSVYAYPTKFL